MYKNSYITVKKRSKYKKITVLKHENNETLEKLENF